MDIIVCVKHIPDTSEAVDTVEIDASGKDIKREALVFKLNDWDEYALEEAVRLAEQIGDRVLMGLAKTNLAVLFYRSRELSYLLEYYRAEELEHIVHELRRSEIAKPLAEDMLDQTTRINHP